MISTRALVAPIGAAALGLAGCFTATNRPASLDMPPSTAPLRAPPAPDAIRDAVPKVEPLSRYGNPPFYDVFGRRYYVLSSRVAYVERGVASWYGPGFHKVRTSSGEPYDMYAMTAAHKSLPLPAYVRVTNLQNGRSIVVRVNDRGPFVDNRIIDLSYTAASRLDMLRNGTAMVEVRAIDPSLPPDQQGLPLLASAPLAPSKGQGAPVPQGATATLSSSAGMQPSATGTANPGIAPGATPTAPVAASTTGAASKNALYVQAGAFADSANAERLATRLRGGEFGKIFVRDDVIAGRKMYRVRIGPVPNVPEFDRIVAALEQAGVHDAHLAMD